jgi:hypothetical protein
MRRRDWKVKKSEWSDKQLEELLRQMPKIEDHRNPRDIYQNLSIKKRKTPTWLLPSVAAVAALFLLLILVPKLMVGTEFSLDKVEQENSVEHKMSLADDSSAGNENRSTAFEEVTPGEQPNILMQEGNNTAVYENEVGNGQVLTYWIPDQQAQILIPVSTIVNVEGNESWLTLFNESMGNLKEEEWGLSDYYPLNATIEFASNENSVVVDVPSDHKYGEGSTSETNFVNVLTKDIFSNSDINKIKLTTNGQNGIELGNFGLMDELIIESEEKHAYFFYYPEGMDIPFTVPSIESYKDINEAIEAMKLDQPVLGLEASLVSSLIFKGVLIEGNKLILTLDENVNLKNDSSTLYSFEALLLTAKEFGIETIQIENAPINQLGPFDLTSEIKVPVAANFRPI